MTRIIKEVKEPTCPTPSPDYVIKECVSCHQTYIAKYWDSKSNWYIELNLTRYCDPCKRSKIQLF